MSLKNVKLPWLLPLAFLLSLLLFSEVFAASKVEIALFKYRGVQQGHDTAAKFDAFRGILEEKLINLKKDVLQTSSKKIRAILKGFILNIGTMIALPILKISKDGRKVSQQFWVFLEDLYYPMTILLTW
jgi:hypothetical protein